MNQSFRAAMLAATSLLFAGASSAASTDNSMGGYASLYVGGSKVNLDCSGETSCKNKTATGRLVLGYSINPVVSVEASYSALGNYSVGQGIDKDKLKARAFGIGMGFRMPFGAQNQWAVTSRVGLSFARLTETSSDSTDKSGQSSRRLYAGLGATYALSPAVDLGVAYDRTTAGFFGTTAKFDSLSAGVTYKF